MRSKFTVIAVLLLVLVTGCEDEEERLKDDNEYLQRQLAVVRGREGQLNVTVGELKAEVALLTDRLSELNRVQEECRKLRQQSETVSDYLREKADYEGKMAELIARRDDLLVRVKDLEAAATDVEALQDHLKDVTEDRDALAEQMRTVAGQLARIQKDYQRFLDAFNSRTLAGYAKVTLSDEEVKEVAGMKLVFESPLVGSDRLTVSCPARWLLDCTRVDILAGKETLPLSSVSIDAETWEASLVFFDKQHVFESALRFTHSDECSMVMISALDRIEARFVKGKEQELGGKATVFDLLSIETATALLSRGQESWEVSLKAQDLGE